MLKLVTITRSDLPAGYQAVQASHAAIDFCFEHPEIAKHWHDKSNTLVSLVVDNEEALREQIALLLHKGIHHSVFYEPDIGNQLTAIAFVADDEQRSHFKHLKLALKNYEPAIKQPRS